MKTILACLIFIINVATYAQLENCELARKEYLNKNPDVKKAGIDPWTHYNYYGKNEGRVWPNCKEGNTEGEEITKTEFNSLKWESKGKTTFEKTSQTEWMEKSNASSFYYEQVSSDSKGVLLKDKNRSGVYIFLDNSNCQYKDANTDWITLYYGNWISTNQFVIPNSVLEISSALDKISDTLEKILYLNSLISHVKKKSTNERTDWDISMYQASFNYKLFYILPNKYNDPRISQDEWISLNDFLNLLGEQAYMSEDSKDMRGCFLYFNILVKQKLGNNSVDIKWPKMVVNEFTENNFPYGGGFYNECRRVINDSKSLPPRTCSYKFSKPTLTVTWIDNRKKCCNPYCNEWSSYSNVKEDNLKNAELQYLNDALDAHFLEVNADNNHRALDYIALSEFKTKNYYNDQILGDFSKLFAAFDVMSGALSSTMLSSMSVLTNETVQEKIIRLKSKKKSLSLYRTTKYCSKSCEQLVDDMGYKCD